VSDIAAARHILRRLIVHDWTPEPVRASLRTALSHMTREPVVRETPRTARPVTPKQRKEIVHLAETTVLSQAEIARRVGLGAQAGGRVSEILHRRAWK
jgi:hypothetical protein